MKRSKSRGPTGRKARRPSSTGSSTASRESSGAYERKKEPSLAQEVEKPRREALRLRVHELNLHGIDTLPASDLLLFIRPQDRPLQGLAGLVDWRLCGGLSRILRRGLFEGRAGESLLTITKRRLPARRLFLYGLGSEGESEALPQALAMVGRAGGRDVAFASLARGPALAEAAEAAARAAYDAGITHLTLLSEEVAAATKALVVVEAHHPWALLQEP